MSARGPFDVVFCRNVLIYFDVEAKKRILEEIHGTLFRGGYLLLGGSETTLNLTGRFKRRIFSQTVLYQAP
jgi:chemotaxis protein methyltransferase CheR